MVIAVKVREVGAMGLKDYLRYIYHYWVDGQASERSRAILIALIFFTIGGGVGLAILSLRAMDYFDPKEAVTIAVTGLVIEPALLLLGYYFGKRFAEKKGQEIDYERLSKAISEATTAAVLAALREDREQNKKEG